MAIVYKGSFNNKPAPEQPAKEPLKVTSFSELRAKAVATSLPEPKPLVEKTTQPVVKQTTTDDGKLIKPKYMQDKSVYYKSSGYLKDLLGEGN